MVKVSANVTDRESIFARPQSGSPTPGTASRLGGRELSPQAEHAEGRFVIVRAVTRTTTDHRVGRSRTGRGSSANSSAQRRVQKNLLGVTEHDTSTDHCLYAAREALVSRGHSRVRTRCLLRTTRTLSATHHDTAATADESPRDGGTLLPSLKRTSHSQSVMVRASTPLRHELLFSALINMMRTCSPAPSCGVMAGLRDGRDYTFS